MIFSKIELLVFLTFLISFPDVLKCFGIIGGKSAPRYPFFVKVQLYRYGSICCGGTVIAPDAVLTAAHCLTVKEKNRWAFPAEIHVTTMGGKNSGFFLDTVSVIDYTMHSSFQPKHIDFNPFDLAILKLQSCVADYEEANGILKPCQGDGEDYEVAVAMGFGMTNLDHRVPPSMLMETQLHYTNCVVYFSAYGKKIDVEKQICYQSKSIDRPAATCFGDFGGPLVHRRLSSSKGEFCLIGVASSSYPSCRNPLAPSVFIRASYFATWIEQSLNYLDSKSATSCAIS